MAKKWQNLDFLQKFRWDFAGHKSAIFVWLRRYPLRGLCKPPERFFVLCPQNDKQLLGSPFNKRRLNSFSCLPLRREGNHEVVEGEKPIQCDLSHLTSSLLTFTYCFLIRERQAATLHYLTGGKNPPLQGLCWLEQKKKLPDMESWYALFTTPPPQAVPLPWQGEARRENAESFYF